VGLIIIPKKKVEAAVVEPVSPIAAELDLYGRLAEEAQPIVLEIAALQAKLKPMLDAKKALEAKIDALEIGDDVEGHVERGAAFEAEIGKRGKSRAIKDMNAVRTAMGTALFMQLATVKLGDLDKYLTPPQLELVLKTERTAHSVKVTKRV